MKKYTRQFLATTVSNTEFAETNKTFSDIITSWKGHQAQTHKKADIKYLAVVFDK